MIDVPFLEELGKAFTPKKIRPDLHAYVMKAGYADVPYSLFGLLFLLLLGIFYVLLGFVLYFFSAAGILLLLAAAIMLLVHFFLNVKIYERTHDLEAVLPEYLTLVSANLKGGLSFEQSLWTAIRPEFGVLANEIGLVSKRVMTGNDVTEALQEFMTKYESPILRRTFELITSEFESGGEIVNIIDKIVDNLRKTAILKRELSASTVTYMMFIGALVLFVCPLLFALSYQLFFLINGFMSSLGGLSTASSVSSPLKLGGAVAKAEDFRLFSILAISLTAIGASAIISVIERGDVRGFFRYLPLFLIVSLLIYFVSSAALNGMFGGITVGG